MFSVSSSSSTLASPRRLRLFFGVMFMLTWCSLGSSIESNNSTTPSNGTTMYPSQCQIAQIFDNLSNGDFEDFFAYVAPDVHWTLMGTHPLAGQYTNRTVFVVDTVERLDNTLDPTQPSSLILVEPVIGGGDQEWSAQQLHGTGVCKNGLVYDNTFAWLTRWNTDGIIVEVNAYLDSALVYKAITENESGIFNYTQPRNELKPGPVGSNCQA